MGNNIGNKTSKRSNLFLLNQLINLRLTADLKKSFLGVLWLILLPLSSMVIWLLMKNAKVLDPGETVVPYLAFIIIVTTLWTAFYDLYRSCSQIFANYSKILLVNKLPMHIVILSELVIAFIKFSIPFVFIIIYYWITGISVWTGLFGFFALLVPWMLLSSAIGLTIGLLTAIAKDFSLLTDNLMRLVMLVSPVIYDISSAQGMLATILKYNPLTYLITNMRAFLFGTELYNMQATLFVVFLVLLFFIIVCRFFMVNTHRILERAQL